MDMSHRAWAELLLVLSSVLVAGAAAAQQAPSEAPAGAQAPSSPTPASTAEQPAKTEASSAAMSSATSAAQPAAAAATGPSPELIKDAKSNGYKIKVVRGQTRFCKSETPIGTHFPTETCLNEDQLRLSMQQAQQARDSMTQSMGATK
jgi:hypothetical protein